VAAYYAAKQQLLRLVKPGGGVVLNGFDEQSSLHLHANDKVRVHRLGSDITVDVSTESLRLVDDVLVVRNPHLVGLHNWHNAACAAGMAQLDGVPAATIGGGLSVYNGIAHRLQLLGVHKGLTWWNDSKATNVDAAVTAVRSFSAGVHLIAGGTGKGSSYRPLVDAARGVVVAVYTIGADAPAIAAACEGALVVHPCQNLAQAVFRIQGDAQPGQHLLLSPACASFDQFKDYADRGNQLAALFAAAQGSP
jgi:UDP-N-acetylmuramoylalanine--D-glutamate ligase